MLPFNQDLLYEMFYITMIYSQMVTKVVICYNTGIIVAVRVIIIGTFYVAVNRLPFDGYRII